VEEAAKKSLEGFHDYLVKDLLADIDSDIIWWAQSTDFGDQN
jgi:hypothetical protein